MKKLTKEHLRELIREEIQKYQKFDLLETGLILEKESDTEDEEKEDEERDPEDEDDSEEDEEAPEPTGPDGFEFDEEINIAMMGFEEKALEVAAAKKEGRIPSIARYLFEAEEDEVHIDIDTFAGDVARLISNYDTLIDMEQAIFNKSMDFLSDKYGDDSAEQLEDILSLKYDIQFDHEYDPEIPEKDVYAVGAADGGGGA